MNTPPLLAAAALLFWGWQTGHWIIGLVAGAILESSRVIEARWSLTQNDFNRLWNICSVLFIGLAAFLLINEGTVSFNDFFVNAGRRPEAIREAGRSALAWFQWFPMIFFPFMVAQAFNEENAVGRATFSWWLRKQEKRNPHSALPSETIDVSFPYIALCLLSASATIRRNEAFYFGITAVIAWALWSVRTRRHSLAAWSAAFLVVAAAGYGGHAGLFRLQKKLEEMNVTWFTRFSTAGFDPREARTHIGSIGRLKMSDAIVLRLRVDRTGPPELLREASYSLYHERLWNNANDRRGFTPLFAEEDTGTWKLLPKKETYRAVNIARYLHGGAGLLALPSGISTVSNLSVGEMETNLFGAAKVKGAPGLVIYDAHYDRGTTFDSKPALDDLRSDKAEPAVVQVARELQLHEGMDAREAMKVVRQFFADKFQYATYLSAAHAPTSNETALARFLLHTRAGHCEYFATATTLLLREAGVPARYAVGYSVQEGSGRKYVVRARHAHSWALVWDGQSWIDFDTTPGSWNAIESAHSSFLQPIKDFFSDLWFQFSKFRWGKTEWRKYFMWAPVPLLIIVIARFFLGKQWKKMRARRKEQRPALARAGIDSDFYLIEKHFASRGLERRASENWTDWLRRIEEQEDVLAQLHRVLVLHQRHRFDPRGLNEAERAELRADVSAWLATREGRGGTGDG